MDGDGRPAGGAGDMRCRVELDGDGRFGRRVTAPNSRAVAVSATAFDTYEGSRAAFEEVCRDHGLLTGGVQHAVRNNGWMWVVRDPGGNRAVLSARSYERHATCRTAYQRFRDLIRRLGERGVMPWMGDDTPR